MRKDSTIGNLTAASHLLSTLEQFMSALSCQDTIGVPWNGLQLTLRQARELIACAQGELRHVESQPSIEESREADPFKKLFQGRPKLLGRMRTVPKRKRAA